MIHDAIAGTGRYARKRSTVAAVTWQARSHPIDMPHRRGVVLVTMCVGLFLVQLDATAVNVALPAIGADLHASVSGLQWVVAGYLVPFAALLLAVGTLGDRYGHRRVVIAGLLLFAAGSVACAVAPNTGMLIAGRAVQGTGGAALGTGPLAVITLAYPQERERAKAIGIWVAVGGLALPLGPLVGGLLVAGPGWRWVFLLNLPIIAASLVPVLTQVPAGRGTAAARLDVQGTALGALTLTSLMLALIEGGRNGSVSPPALAAIAAALVFGLAFGRAERRHPNPALPPELFRDRRFSTANAAAAAMALVHVGTVFLITLYLQGIQHRTPLAAGAALLPMFLPLTLLAPFTGRITARYGPRIPATTGLILGATGTALLTRVNADSRYVLLLPALVLLGTGLGLLTTPLVATAIAAVPHNQAGLAIGINNTARQTGAAIGIALFGTLAGSTTDPHRFMAGLHLAGITAATLYLLTAAATATFLPPRAPTEPFPT
ncbi:MFS transporter [Streptomyces sp. NPDC002602]|uniref:MFS transporter n=1 Tax=Streptomyces sp. NPDC002602 TaxID=3364654 RepID=UPI0036AAA209